MKRIDYEYTSDDLQWDEYVKYYIEKNFYELMMKHRVWGKPKTVFKKYGLTNIGWLRKNGKFELDVDDFDRFNPLIWESGIAMKIDTVALGHHSKSLSYKSGSWEIVSEYEYAYTRKLNDETKKKRVEELVGCMEKRGNMEKANTLKMKAMFGMTTELMDWIDEEMVHLRWYPDEKEQEWIRHIKNIVEESRKEVEEAWADKEYKDWIKKMFNAKRKLGTK